MTPVLVLGFGVPPLAAVSSDLLARGVMKPGRLVGTDLVQGVPLVAAAALSHSLYGDLDLSLTLPLVLGSIPGVYLGAQLSSRLNGGFIRGALAFVLLASGLKMLGLDNAPTAAVLVSALLVAPLLWMHIRRLNGFPALATTEVRQARPGLEQALPAGGQK